MNKITVLGSMNMDIVYKIKEAPKDGETIFGTNLEYICGGKGANQAVAASRLGSKVSMIGRIGADANGKILVEALKNDGINTSFVFEDVTENSGTAIISVNEIGSNSIVVISGSNMKISNSDVLKATDEIKKSCFIVAQLEVPIPAIEFAFDLANKNGVKTVLNPAPALEISDEIYSKTDIIIPNETETFELTGIKVTDEKSATDAAKFFFRKGVGHVIITMGEKGAALISKEKTVLIPANNVKAVDTTAAGDGFVGALVSYLCRKNDKQHNEQGRVTLNFEALEKAVKFANKVSSLVVQRNGAQPSLPYLREIEENYE